MRRSERTISDYKAIIYLNRTESTISSENRIRNVIIKGLLPIFKRRVPVLGVIEATLTLRQQTILTLISDEFYLFLIMLYAVYLQQ